jgi:alginate O-acetyltransferase complex protein AlgI
MLTLLSYFFYGWANPMFVFLMLFSTAVDYFCGLAIAGRLRDWRRPVEALEKGGSRNRGQKVALAISIVTNLGLLGFFKYFNFGVDSWNAALLAFGFEAGVWDTTLRVILPLGISFYTFQSMSYSIDVYRGDARALRNPTDFACYVSMFPQLVAGPIIRFQEVDDQMRYRTHTSEKFARGAAMFSIGMFKKIVLANPCGMIADTCFEAGSISMVDAWYGVTAYAMQIYFDFSAYSDMAIGLGLMLGFVFPKNFDSPYKSDSITDFWRRWHISLSTWLRDYLYVPLGGNRKGSGRTYVNLAMVMVFGGLWHGASWNFVIWGGIHGAWLAFERFQGKESPYRHLPRPLRVLITFVIVCVAWVFFRAADLPSALRYLGSMFGMGGAQGGAGLIEGLIYDPYYLVMMGAATVTAFFGMQTWDWTRRIGWGKAILCLLALWVALILLETQAYNPFIYFIF